MQLFSCYCTSLVSMPDVPHTHSLSKPCSTCEMNSTFINLPCPFTHCLKALSVCEPCSLGSLSHLGTTNKGRFVTRGECPMDQQQQQRQRLLLRRRRQQHATIELPLRLSRQKTNQAWSATSIPAKNSPLLLSPGRSFFVRPLL